MKCSTGVAASDAETSGTERAQPQTAETASAIEVAKRFEQGDGDASGTDTEKAQSADHSRRVKFPAAPNIQAKRKWKRAWRLDYRQRTCMSLQPGYKDSPLSRHA